MRSDSDGGMSDGPCAPGIRATMTLALPVRDFPPAAVLFSCAPFMAGLFDQRFRESGPG